MEAFNKHLSINYCACTNLIGEHKLQTADWQKIDQESNGKIAHVTYVALFVNDQIYNYSIELESSLQGSGKMRHLVKKTFKDLKLAVENYNRLIFSKLSINADMFADITQSMEEDIKPSIDILMYQISGELLKNGISGATNKASSICVVINVLCQCSKMISKVFKEDVSKQQGFIPTNFDYLCLDTVEKKSLDLSTILINPDQTVDFNKIDSVMMAFEILTRRLLDPKIFQKAIQ